MTVEMQQLLNDQLNAAKTAEEVDGALVASMRSLIDCQRKTADRVKKLVIEEDRRQERYKGAKAIVELAKVIVSAGGGAALLKLLGG